MRILHTSDWHCGRTLHGTDLAPAFALFADWLVDTVEREAVDLLLLSGDAYDRAIPSTDSIRSFNALLLRLTALCQVVVTSGNHDSATRLGSLAALLKDELTIVTELDAIGTPLVFSDPDGTEVSIYPVPYVEPEIGRYELARLLAERRGESHEDSCEPLERSHQAVINGALELIEYDLLERRRAGDTSCAIAMVHAFITGGKSTDSERYIAVGGVEDVRSASFDLSPAFQASGFRGLSYVAAGHLHRPQDIRHESLPIRYSGSPIAYSFSEASSTKSVTLIDVCADGSISGIRALETPVWRPLAVIEDSLDSLLSDKYQHLVDHFVSITVTDDERPAALNDRIRKAFPFALVITHVPRNCVNVDAAPYRHQLATDEDICITFFEEAGGRPLSDEERRLVREIVEAERQKASVL